MKTSNAIDTFWDYQILNLKNTIRNYHYFLRRFKKEYSDFDISKISSEDVMTFLTKVTEGQKQSIKKRLKQQKESHGQFLTGILSMGLFSKLIIPEIACCLN